MCRHCRSLVWKKYPHIAVIAQINMFQDLINFQICESGFFWSDMTQIELPINLDTHKKFV